MGRGRLNERPGIRPGPKAPPDLDMVAGELMPRRHHGSAVLGPVPSRGGDAVPELLCRRLGPLVHLGSRTRVTVRTRVRVSLLILVDESR